MKKLLLLLTISLFSYTGFAQATGGNCGLRPNQYVNGCTVGFDIYGANVGDSSTHLIWDYGDGSSYTDSVNEVYPGVASHTYASAGTYTLTLTIDTCWVTMSVTVNCGTTGINVLEETLDFNLYPNPAQNSLTVETTSSSITDLVISNQLGQVIKSIDVSSVNGYKIPVDINDLEKGNYFILVKSEEQSVIKKFIKQ